MNYLNTSCYHIFIDQGIYKKFEGDEGSIANFQDFAKLAVSHTHTNENTQEYLFNENSIIKNEFIKYKNSPKHWEELCEKFSYTLLNAQQASQKRIEHLDKKVIPGSLLLIHCKKENSDTDTLVLVKMEQEEFANVINFEHQYGLSTEKKALNTALITFGPDNDCNMLVSRANAFWINFLDISPLRSNNINTANAFNAIDKSLRKVKKDGFKADHLALRNHLITYLRNAEGKLITYTDLIDTVFSSHQSIDSQFKSTDLVKELQELPKKNKGKLAFDTHFEIDLADVNARKRTNTIDLTDKIELNLKDGIENLEDTITAHEVDGRKCIIIFTDEGFKYFKKD